MTGEIRNDDHVARYCTKLRIDTDGTPLPSAFELRENDEYLSVNWLEYFGTSDVKDCMRHIRKEFRNHHTISKNGRFAVLNVEDAKRVVNEQLGRLLLVKDLQENDYPSHAGIYGYLANDDEVPLVLSDMVRRADMHSRKTVEFYAV